MPKQHRGEVWKFLSEQHLLRQTVSSEPPANNTPYKDLLRQVSSEQHAILIDLGNADIHYACFSNPTLKCLSHLLPTSMQYQHPTHASTHTSLFWALNINSEIISVAVYVPVRHGSNLDCNSELLFSSAWNRATGLPCGFLKTFHLTQEASSCLTDRLGIWFWCIHYIWGEMSSRNHKEVHLTYFKLKGRLFLSRMTENIHRHFKSSPSKACTQIQSFFQIAVTNLYDHKHEAPAAHSTRSYSKSHTHIHPHSTITSLSTIIMLFYRSLCCHVQIQKHMSSFWQID